jgi:hypothetical protein
MSESVEKAIDVAADVAAEVAQQAEGAEEVIRSLSQVKVAYTALGVAIGSAVGSLIAFNVAYRRAEAKYSQIAAEEISEMREHYNEKVVALDLSQTKGDLEELVRERGYSTSEPETGMPPMAISPPKAVVDAAQEAAEEEEVSAEAETTVASAAQSEELEVRNLFHDNAPPEDTWDWHEERRKRSPLNPYVIHIEERDDNAAYDSVTWTYYEEDDVLCRENDEVVSVEERDKVVGEANLEKFGHGSGDAAIVYVRNDQIEVDFEIVRSPNSYAEEVHGFDPSEPEIRHAHRRTRVSIDDE